MEVCLAKAFASLSSQGDEDDENAILYDGTVPPHFYGEIARTEMGCHILHQKRHVPEFAMFIKQHGLEWEDLDLIRKLKSVLWAVVRFNAL
jgi:rapamycin-insensitive companion of mTOR